MNWRVNTAASRGHWLTQLVTLLKATCGEKSLDRPGVQTGPETNASFHPEVWPVEHLLPERNLLARPVHPGNIATQVTAGPKIEQGSSPSPLPCLGPPTQWSAPILAKSFDDKSLSF